MRVGNEEGRGDVDIELDSGEVLADGERESEVGSTEEWEAVSEWVD